MTALYPLLYLPGQSVPLASLYYSHYPVGSGSYMDVLRIKWGEKVSSEFESNVTDA